MSGLQKILKLFGSVAVTDNNGKSQMWTWDYKNDKPRLLKEMTKEEIKENERLKWNQRHNL